MRPAGPSADRVNCVSGTLVTLAATIDPRALRDTQRVLPALRCVLLVVWSPSLASAFGRLGNLFTRQATARALEEDEPECADSADPGAAQCKIWADAGERRQQPSQCTTSGGSSR